MKRVLTPLPGVPKWRTRLSTTPTIVGLPRHNSAAASHGNLGRLLRPRDRGVMPRKSGPQGPRFCVFAALAHPCYYKSLSERRLRRELKMRHPRFCGASRSFCALGFGLATHRVTVIVLVRIVWIRAFMQYERVRRHGRTHSDAADTARAHCRTPDSARSYRSSSSPPGGRFSNAGARFSQPRRICRGFHLTPITA